MKKAALLIVILLVLGIGGYLAFTSVSLPNVRAAIEDGVEPSQTSQIVAQDGTLLMSYGKFHYKPVTLKAISPNFINALLSTEDRRFFEHQGVDPVGVLRALLVNITRQRLHQGASTITQQLARNIFLTNERSFERKIKEVLLAIKLENQLSKQEILELYVNNIYFGEGAYGIGAASNVYFGKSPKQLTVDEAALLAGLPQAPSRYNPYVNRDLAKKRRDEVLQNMAEWGKITRDQAKRFQRTGIHLRPRRGVAGTGIGEYFSRYIVTQASEALGVDEESFWQQGVRVVTTLDPVAQRLAENAAASANAQFGRNNKNNQYAVFSINNQGHIIAYVGGKDFDKSQYDRVSLAQRQAGSVFKVFVYTAAMEAGMSPKTVYNDDAVTFPNYGNWHPENYDKHHYGLMSLATAFIHSNNVVAAKLINDVQPGPVVRMARKLGVRSNLKSNLSLALGSADVTLKELTTAVSVFPNMGHLVQPYGILRIENHKGNTIYKYNPTYKAALDRRTRDTMVTLLRGVNLYGTGRGAALSDTYSAGKTGTSDDYRNAWYIGFTPTVTTGVWVGNDDNTPMPGISGGSLPARIWHGYMSQYKPAHKEKGFELIAGYAVDKKDFFDYDISLLSDSEKARYQGNMPQAGDGGAATPQGTEPLLEADSNKFADGVNRPQANDEQGNLLPSPPPSAPSATPGGGPPRSPEAAPSGVDESPSSGQMPLRSTAPTQAQPVVSDGMTRPGMIKPPPSNPTPQRAGLPAAPPRPRFGQ
ncbi:MAG: PBP1A family penicillin-binding protein [Cyanobacteria bacterium HKST-UBA06]|nr:PBP1A family penicillin-binding protein [Cyanobacteria bacterium HKST-UBA06]